MFNFNSVCALLWCHMPVSSKGLLPSTSLQKFRHWVRLKRFLCWISRCRVIWCRPYTWTSFSNPHSDKLPCRALNENRFKRLRTPLWLYCGVTRSQLELPLRPSIGKSFIKEWHRILLRTSAIGSRIWSYATEYGQNILTLNVCMNIFTYISVYVCVYVGRYARI